MTDALLSTPVTWPNLTDRRTLVLGLGGGSDAISAYAIATLLGPDVAYGNTKHNLDADLIRVSPSVGRFPEGVAIRGTTKIERRLPHGAHGSPLVFACPRDEPTDDLARELAAMKFDVVVGVDTGGDSLDSSKRGDRGRDRRMIDVLRALGLPALLVVVAPGSDGQQAREDVHAAMLAEVRAGRYRGAFSLAPCVPILREHGRLLGAERTPNIICRSFDDAVDPVAIPRGRRPRISRAWLMSGFVFEIAN